MHRTHATPRSLTIALILALALTAGAAQSSAQTVTGAGPPAVDDGTEAAWVWPLARFRLERAFEAPAHRYGPGHRGIDLRTDPAAQVRAPAEGTVAFSGPVAGRGILTIDHGGGFVSTLEPVTSELRAGSAVRAGDAVAALALGGHSPPGALHFGVRLHGQYVNPMLLLGGVPRAVLLPCC